MGLIDNDKDLSEDQKKDLRVYAIECLARFEKSLSEFNEDPINSSNLFDEVSINYFDQNFTENELKELITFMQTPTGKKTGKLFLLYYNSVNKTFNTIFNKRFAEFSQIKGKEEENKLRLKIQEMKTPNQ
jgi:hypothetical protein